MMTVGVGLWDPDAWGPFFRDISVPLLVAAIATCVHEASKPTPARLEEADKGDQRKTYNTLTERKCYNKLWFCRIAFVISSLAMAFVWFRLGSEPLGVQRAAGDPTSILSAFAIASGYILIVTQLGYGRLRRMKQGATLSDDWLIRFALRGVPFLFTLLVGGALVAFWKDQPHRSSESLLVVWGVAAFVPLMVSRPVERYLRRRMNEGERKRLDGLLASGNVERLVPIYWSMRRLYLLPAAGTMVISGVAVAIYWWELTWSGSLNTVFTTVLLIVFALTMGVMPLNLSVELLDAVGPTYPAKVERPYIRLEEPPTQRFDRRRHRRNRKRSYGSG